MLLRWLPVMMITLATPLSWRQLPSCFSRTQTDLIPLKLISGYPRIAQLSFCSSSQISSDITDSIPEQSSKRDPLKPVRLIDRVKESQRELTVLKRLKRGEIVGLISDAGMLGISDPVAEFVKLCVNENITDIPIPGPSALIAALSASGLAADEFTFVGFLSKHARSRRVRLIASADEKERKYSIQCVIPREMIKIHEEFWRGTLGKAKESVETPSDSQLENELGDLISCGHSLSMAVKLVSEKTSVRRNTIYSSALTKLGKQPEVEDT
ncbi:hypothetical protein MANES_18G021412v8 [Manihot esculenta]|uniref:Uncharacterized protein n=1 Tax=Manihot esculenta TaxID=3983 RepID=A0ACB7FXM7_MANES|nr:hypothetical protein MANES_18G021412v8 [Manihot esculenta]